ncbi:TPA: hypothetical protein QDA74_005117 [Burkholderia territorii]|uniref:hypothetical protein n=1 Tax=Burkholderia territorii TaxID=1503055 RepID=UPI0011C8F872|nr:hypothetical protein [Burkholderia territorii]TXG04364.1 hypothetical protein FU139_28565 [Burkholderia territorii]HDR8860857.1 hypothetical protein [Burkholderia territorii]HDR8866992.1 hypothetical protein [Burkholderia territorii]HDR8873322.1 hypothetical protein [Burkholderia territorii]HDR8879582.1 hypothetical protein [Burkholderia territorii]
MYHLIRENADRYFLLLNVQIWAEPFPPDGAASARRRNRAMAMGGALRLPLPLSASDVAQVMWQAEKRT